MVTGADGFAGRHLVRRLSELGNVVIPWTRKTFDVRDEGRVLKTVANAEFDTIVHLAALSNVKLAQQNPRLAWEVNLQGTMNLGQAVLRHSSHANFVYVGTALSYGESFNRVSSPISEQMALDPVSVYGASKAAADVWISEMGTRGLKSVRLRPFNHTGAYQSAEYAASNFARQLVNIERGKKPAVISVGDLSPLRDFLHINDVVDAYSAACLVYDNTELAINISTASPITIRSLLETLISISKLDVVLNEDPQLFRPTKIPVMSGQNERALKVLGWKPHGDLRDALTSLLGWWRAQTELPPVLKTPS